MTRRQAVGILGSAAAVAAAYPVYRMTRRHSQTPRVSNTTDPITERRLEQELERLLARPEVHNAIVVVESVDGTQKWSGAAGPLGRGGHSVSTDTPVYLASVTKLYTAALVLRLAERGRVALDDPMTAHLPMELVHGLHRLDGTDHTSAITIRHLLSHTSGLGDYFTDRPRGGRSLSERLVEEGDQAWGFDEVVERVRSELRPHFVPQPEESRRRKIRYSDTNYQVLGALVEAIEDAPLHEVLARELFEPLGLRHTYLHPFRRGDSADPPAPIWFGEIPREMPLALGSFDADGGVVATLGDAVAFARALFGGGILKADTLEAMQGGWNRFGLPLDAAALQLPSWPIEYGLGLMRFRLPAPLNGFRRMPALLGHTGSVGSWLFYCPELDAIVAGTVNQATAGALPYRFLPRLLRALT